MKEAFDLMKNKIMQDRRIGRSSLEAFLEILKEVEAEYGKKQKCFVSIDGCDDSTQFEIDLSESEYEFLKRIAEISEETSTYGCMPTMTVRKVLLGK